MNEPIYQQIRAESDVDEKGNICVRVYGSQSQYPFIVLPNTEAVRKMRNFLDHIIHQENLKLCKK